MSGLLQTTVNFATALGVPGELFDDGPMRAVSGYLDAASAAYNIIGATIYTYAANAEPVGAGNAGTPAQMQAGNGGGANGIFAGLLANPKTYASAGAGGDPLSPTMVLPNYTQAEFLQMGSCYAIIGNAVNIGDLVYYDNTTGAMNSMAPVAVGTATQSTTTLTVATLTAGNIGIGTTFNLTGNDTAKVVALGSGTGGTGTYTVDTSQTIDSAVAFTADSKAPSGKTLVPNCIVSQFGGTDATTDSTGLCVIKLTN